MARNATVIRRFDQSKDLEAIRECLIELQDFERQMDSRMPPGREIAVAYVTQMLQRCGEHDGQIFVGEVDGQIAGYVTVLTKVRSEEMEDGFLEYGLISDLVVRRTQRRSGIGKSLLESAQLHARDNDVKWLRIGVLSGNTVARELYAAMGFSEWYAEFEKELGQVGIA